MPDPSAAERAIEAMVIGGSAGSVQGLAALLAALPPSFPAAVLVVVHVPQRGSASLAAMLAARCRLPLAEAIDKQPIVAGQVILAPAGYHLLVEPDSRVSLSVDPPVLHSRPAIDPLFESAALRWGPALLAVILSGASCDGADGARAVRRRGGRVWVQDPATAEARMMPSAALERAGADAVLDFDAMCRRVSAIGVP